MSSGPAHDIIFYDGTCGLCHAAVRFVLPRDPAGSFHFAPLQGETFRKNISPEQQRPLPDSLVLLQTSRQVLTRSSAAIHVLARLPGPWPALARVISWVPRPLRDLAYDLIARLRRRLFRAPPQLCPIVPPSLRRRFEL